MIVIPAIDIKNGKCVRLMYGDFEKQTVYSDDPVEMAKKWESHGAERLHVIDLDGALEGKPVNLEIILRIKKETKMLIQTGGGIRTVESIKKILGEGIDRVIVGTSLFEEAGVIQSAYQIFKDQIMAALDVKNGFVTSHGWKESTGFPLIDALKLVEKLGGQEIIFTDISRDGALKGANVRGVKAVMDQTPMKVYASGGVTSLRDIQELIEINCFGCVVGKAIYEGKLDLKEAIRISK